MSDKSDDMWVDGTLWKWAVGAAAAFMAAWGAWSWSSSPVGPSAEQEADPTTHTAPYDKTPGDITRDKLDPRSGY